jgi:hypothetical protein
MTTLLNASYIHTASELSHPISDMYDTMSDWFDIRVAEMSGFDYIFAPMEICDQITDFVTLQNFLQNIQTILRSEPERTLLIGFNRRHDGVLELDRYDVDWSDTLIIDCRRSTLNGSAQFDFIEMLLEHSENLIDGE